MFIGTGIASQQAEHARQIFNAVRVLWPLYAQRHCLQKLNEKAERKYYTVLEFKILMMALAIAFRDIRPSRTGGERGHKPLRNY